ncbi:hypothetical protein DAEQUDRAFT_7237 [Daedalea quercina L-15889]|uniref:Uncharacterized protein n=1 Tax=Daedalea quercina L-15889 TaxID=1314783 RepID=A0A165UEL8_9APHY|nr:hypothetical protein DAEQUDRAFT_7237 [Daedalea quercina L-15889]
MCLRASSQQNIRMHVQSPGIYACSNRGRSGEPEKWPSDKFRSVRRWPRKLDEAGAWKLRVERHILLTVISSLLSVFSSSPFLSLLSLLSPICLLCLISDLYRAPFALLSISCCEYLEIIRRHRLQILQSLRPYEYTVCSSS